jgi:hypothetical protein
MARSLGKLFVSIVIGALPALGACSSASSDAGGSGGGAAVGNGGGANSTGSGGSGGISLGGAAGQSAGGNGGSGGSGGCNQAIDIVFVMDVSTSMDAFLNKLATDIPAVDQAVKQLNLTVAPHYGLVVFVDDFTFVNSAQPYQDVQTLKADFQSWAQFTMSNQQTQSTTTNTTWPENSMDALYAAASQFAWRPPESTLRIVIHTTDDTFWNGPMTTADGVPVTHGYADTLAELESQQVRVFSFANKLGGPFESDDVSAGWFGPYNSQPAMPDATGGAINVLDDVLTNKISLASAIPAAVQGTLCKPYPVPK